MDFNDTPEEAAFRARAQDFLKKTVQPKSDEKSSFQRLRDENEYLKSAKAYQRAKAEAAGQHQQRPARGHGQAKAQCAWQPQVGGQGGRQGGVGPRRKAHGGAKQQQGGEFGSAHKGWGNKAGVVVNVPSM